MSSTKQQLFSLLVATAVAFSATLSANQDFSQYDTSALMQLRDQNRYWDQVDKDAYRNEMQSRMQGLSTDERSAVRAEAGLGQSRSQGQSYGGKGHGQQLRDGSGSGGRYRRGAAGSATDAVSAGSGYGGGQGGGRGRGGGRVH